MEVHFSRAYICYPVIIFKECLFEMGLTMTASSYSQSLYMIPEHLYIALTVHPWSNHAHVGVFKRLQYVVFLIIAPFFARLWQFSQSWKYWNPVIHVITSSFIPLFNTYCIHWPDIYKGQHGFLLTQRWMRLSPCPLTSERVVEFFFLIFSDYLEI